MSRIRLVTFFGYGLIIALFITDRISKYYFVSHPEYARGVFAFGRELGALRFEKNYGIAFGIDLFFPLLILLTIGALAYLLRLWRQARLERRLWPALGIFLIIAGAVSNLADRVGRGYVVDYIDVPHFAVFNLADSMICLGLAVMVLSGFWRSEKNIAKS